MSDTLLYILLMIAVTNAVRIVPVLFIRGEIRNTFVRSFLYYVPYATLAVMTFPAIMHATQRPEAGAAALVAGIIAAAKGWGLFPVAAVCCTVVLVIEQFIL